MSLLLVARITPLFFIASIVMALLAYWILAGAIVWRHQEAVRCSAIVCAEFLRGHVTDDGPTERQKEDLEQAGTRNAISLVLTTSGAPPLLLGKTFEGEAISHQEVVTSLDGEKFSIQAKTPKQLMDEELARWRRILIGFCLGATVFGSALALGFSSIVSSAAEKLTQDANTIEQAPPSSKGFRIAELAGVHEALQGLHASLEHRHTTLANIENADFTSLDSFEGSGFQSASAMVSGTGGEPFHLSTNCGGVAGVAPDRLHAAAAAAKLGRQLTLPNGPATAILEEVAKDCPTLEAVLLDGIRMQRWSLRDGLLSQEPWQPIGIIAPSDHIGAETLCSKILTSETLGSAIMMVKTLKGSISGPSGIVAVINQRKA